MNQEVKNKFVEALRSGEYIKGKYQLRADCEYCLIGVLCDLYAKQYPKQAMWEKSKGTWYFKYYFGNEWRYEDALLPFLVSSWAELEESQSLTIKTYSQLFQKPVIKKDGLINLNDKSQITFEQFSDLIENQL